MRIGPSPEYVPTASMSNADRYDTIGIGYRDRRRPDPRIAVQFHAAIGGTARSVLNVGAGAGSYEPDGPAVFALEPSRVMLEQHDGHRRVQAVAQQMPFADNTFDVAMASLTVHHWPDPAAGLLEMKRVARRQVVFAFDAQATLDFWLLTDYLPEFRVLEHEQAASAEVIADVLGTDRIENVLIPHDCTDGFQAAYWRRPERYLDPDARLSISTFSFFTDDVIDAAMARLAADLESGAWHERHGALLDQDVADWGYRLVVAEQ
jgi:SAM-dependent methyltransferase